MHPALKATLFKGVGGLISITFLLIAYAAGAL